MICFDFECKEETIMPDMDDYMAFKLTSGDGDGGGGGSSGGCLPVILIALAILGLLGKIVG